MRLLQFSDAGHVRVARIAALGATLINPLAIEPGGLSPHGTGAL